MAQATHIRLQYLPCAKSRVWRNSSLTMWAEARDTMERTAKAIAAQDGWHDWRIIPHQP